MFGKGWREATARDVEAFKDWRLTDVRNDDRIKAASFDRDRAALNTFYTWAFGKYGVQNPVSGVALASNSGGRSGQGVGTVAAPPAQPPSSAAPYARRPASNGSSNRATPTFITAKP